MSLKIGTVQHLQYQVKTAKDLGTATMLQTDGQHQNVMRSLSPRNSSFKTHTHTQLFNYRRQRLLKRENICRHVVVTSQGRRPSKRTK
jgi:hypothetical protein